MVSNNFVKILQIIIIILISYYLLHIFRLNLKQIRILRNQGRDTEN